MGSGDYSSLWLGIETNSVNMTQNDDYTYNLDQIAFGVIGIDSGSKQEFFTQLGNPTVTDGVPPSAIISLYF